MAKKEPNIRFKGFEGEWEESTMSAKFNFDTPHNSLSRDKLNAEDGDVKDIHYGDILVKYNAVVDAQADDIPHITNSSVSDYADSLLMNGDVVFADTAEDETAGKAVEIQNADDNNVVAGLHTIVARPKDYFSPNFLGHRFNSDSYHSQLVPLLQGIKVLSISKAALADTTFSWPQEEDEQQKIGEFFQQLDELIGAKEQELEKLRQMKQALLDKMFPSDEEIAPPIRFKGFTDKWMRMTIKETLTQPLEYGLNAAAGKFDGNRKYLRITDIDDETRLFNKTDVTSPKLDYISDSYRLQEGDLVFARTGASVGKTYLYSQKDGDVYFAGFLIRARIKENNSPYFIFTITQTSTYDKFIKITSQRTGQPGVNAQEYESFSFLAPSYDEQCLIGDFFRSQDEAINSSKEEIAKLRTLKHACLQQMFA